MRRGKVIAAAAKFGFALQTHARFSARTEKRKSLWENTIGDPMIQTLDLM
jgi:hypothetical protein